MDFVKILASTTEPAFATDGDGRIVGWNRAAEVLTGYSVDTVMGRACHEILCGQDVFGNRYCEEHCLISNMARRHEPIRPFELNIQIASGEHLRVRFSMLVLPDAESPGPTMIHIFNPAPPGEHAEEAASAPPGPVVRNETDPAPNSGSETDRARLLTAREVEILRLMAAGNTSQDIANQLFIGLSTVRTHTQNILRKLEIHSQIEAVAFAFRRGLI